MSDTTPITHSHRHCEAGDPDYATSACRCDERAALRAVALECSNASAMSSETQEHAAINVNVLLEDMMRSMVAGLTQRVRAEGRVPILSTLHLIGQHDVRMEADAVKLAVLTVPEGVSPVSPLVLEVADDWMRARGLRR